MHKTLLLCSKIFAFNLICAHSDLKGNKRLFYISEKLKKLSQSMTVMHQNKRCILKTIWNLPDLHIS